MTQLFDTATYDEATEAADEQASFGRHLRSMPTGEDLSHRTTQWRLDATTIETGRKGIQAARQALQDAAKAAAAQDKPQRKAA